MHNKIQLGIVQIFSNEAAVLLVVTCYHTYKK